LIPSAQAQALVVGKHYLHRRASCSQAVGLFCGEALVGVAMFGSPASPTICRGICGADERLNVAELTRLWVDDAMPRNTESWFLSRALHLVPKEIIIAYADPSAGHEGYIYQACSFLYTGLGPPRKMWQPVGGTSSHFHRSFTSSTSYAEARRRPDLEYVPAVRKHRYIKFNCRGKRRAELLAKLRYPLCPYPKRKEFDAEEERPVEGL